MISLEESIKDRISIRKFLNEDIENEELYEMVEYATKAPNAGNCQFWHYYVIKNIEIKKKMHNVVLDEIKRLSKYLYEEEDKKKVCSEEFLNSATFFVNASVVIAVSTKRYFSFIDKMLFLSGKSEQEIDSIRCRSDLQSIGAAIQNLLLIAYSKGYGACWLTAPLVAQKNLEDILKIEPPYNLADIIALGKPNELIHIKFIRISFWITGL